MSVRRRKDPIHLIFQVCSQLTPDPTWKDFLNQCSYGYFPTGVKFTNGNLVCNRKKNSFTVQVPSDPEHALPLLISVFRDRLGIKSVKEKKSEVLIFDRKYKEAIFQSWTDVRTKTGKHCLLGNYVEALGDFFCMSYHEKIKALALLEICINTSIISKTHIHVEDGRIVRIDGFNFDPETRTCFFTGKINIPTPEVVSQPLFYDNVKQTDFNGQFMNALKEHSEKIQRAVFY